MGPCFDMLMGPYSEFYQLHDRIEAEDRAYERSLSLLYYSYTFVALSR